MKDLLNSLKKSFRDKEYRHGYVDEFLNANIATQIKVLREQRGWSQKELAKRAGMLQPRISILENVDYSSWSISALRKIAEAFDLTLCVSFESFGRRVQDIFSLKRENLERPSFDEDDFFEQTIENVEARTDREAYQKLPTEIASEIAITLRSNLIDQQNNVITIGRANGSAYYYDDARSAANG